MQDACRVTTITIVALDEFESFPPGAGELLIPSTLSEHPEWKQLGIRTEPLSMHAPGVELAPNIMMQQGDASFRTISPFGTLVLIKWANEFPIDRLAEIDWAAHWRASWASATAAWPAISAAHALPPQDWMFSFSIVEGPHGRIDAAARKVKELADLTSRLEAHGLWIGIGWNGGLAVRETAHCESGLDAIDAIATLVSLRWQVEAQAIRLVRDMLGDDHSANSRDAQTAKIVSISRRVYHAQTALEPSIFCVYGGDEVIARAFVEGWGADKLSARVDTAIDRLSAANEI